MIALNCLFIYTQVGKPLVETDCHLLHTNDLAYIDGLLLSVWLLALLTLMTDLIGLHRVANPSHMDGAVSLHLYSPPYAVCTHAPTCSISWSNPASQECGVYDDRTGSSRPSGCMTFYSCGGKKL